MESLRSSSLKFVIVSILLSTLANINSFPSVNVNHNDLSKANLVQLNSKSKAQIKSNRCKVPYKRMNKTKDSFLYVEANGFPKEVSSARESFYQGYSVEVNGKVDKSSVKGPSSEMRSGIQRSNNHELSDNVNNKPENNENKPKFEKEEIEKGSITPPNNITKPDNRSITPPNSSNYTKLVWEDNFDGNKLDRKRWVPDVNCWGGGNEEEQCYVDHDDVIKVENGNLVITPIAEPNGYTLKESDKCNIASDLAATGACTNKKSIRSGRIHTNFATGGSWLYGRFEMRAKLPEGKYLWPAFWMMPEENKYGIWPTSGEIDIMEAKGQNLDTSSSAIHFSAKHPNNNRISADLSTPNLMSDFNIYSAEWNDKYIKTFVNGKQVMSFDLTKIIAPETKLYSKPGQPFDQKFYIILNLAISGNYFGPNRDFNIATTPKTWKQPSYIIDYIRVYQ